MKYYFIINPKAGHGKGLQMIPQIKKVMEQRGRAYEIHITTHPGEGEAFIRERGDEGARFYVCGGDGTLHEAINGAYGNNNVSIGLIPTGTGNDFVKNFENRDAFFNIEAQLCGEEIPIDVICVNDRVAVNMINIGFDCDVVVEAEKMKRIPLVQGVLAYWLGLCKRFFGVMGQTLEITDDMGRCFRGEFLLCTFANGSFCGGAFQSSPYAQIDDGLLDFAGIRKFSRGKLLRMLPSYQKGTYLKKMQGDKGVQFQQCRGVKVHGEKPMYASVDGEIIEFLDLEMSIAPRAIQFILPLGASKAKKPKVDWV